MRKNLVCHIDLGKMDMWWQSRNMGTRVQCAKDHAGRIWKGVQEPTVFCQEIDKKFGVTTMTSVKVKTRDERPLKRRKVCDAVDENR